MDVLKKINKIRLERNWSVYRLSIESGISQSTLTNMFNRETLPSITTLECICSAFGMTLSDFFLEDNANKTTDETEIFALYRSAPEEVKAAIAVLLRKALEKN